MPELNFRVTGAEPDAYSAAPLLNFRLEVENAEAGQYVDSILLRCQVRIEPAQRTYSEGEQQRLRDLFGEPSRWGQTARSMLWAQTNIVVPGFSGGTAADLPMPCTFDMTVASAKYFAGVETGGVPLLLLFSGTVFYRGPQGLLQVCQIPWSKEAAFDLPVEAWKKMMDRYYPNMAWLCLRRDVFERLHQYKIDRGIPTWEQTLESILP